MSGIRSIHAVALTVGLALGMYAPGDADAQQPMPRPAAQPRTAQPQAGTPPSTPDTPGRPPGAAAAPISAASSAAPPTDMVDEVKAWDMAAPPPGARVYMLGTGDVVRINVYQQPDMTTETRVSEAGTVTIPLLGPVLVSGGTAKQAEARITALLRNRGFVREPQVNVTVMLFKSRQVSVLGYVNRPGRYSLEEGTYSITDVLSLAGGVVAGAADVVALVRTQNGKSQRFEVDIPALFKGGNFDKNLEVMGGDTLYVDRAPTFYIYGEVQRPGAFRLEKDMTLMQGLSMAGGITQRGTEKNIQIRRRDANGQYANYRGALTDVLQGDDVVYVRESLF